jgi:hypothetical protein
LDIPYFWNADRRSLPHWLLALMKQSKLFDDIFIPQVQGVAWLSKHQLDKSEIESELNGGNFYFFPYKQEYKDEYLMVKSLYNSAILVDGTQVIHAVERFKSNESTPSFNKNERYYIKYSEKKDEWHLFDSKNNFMRAYPHQDVRVSLVWRVQCFENEEERLKYRNQRFEDQIKLENIFEVFKNDLIMKGKFKKEENMRPLEFITLLVNEYSNYPNTRNSFFGYFNLNYCLLPQILPNNFASLIEPILNFFC